MSPHIAHMGDKRPRPIEAAFCRIKLLYDRFDQRRGIMPEDVAFSNPASRHWLTASEANQLAKAVRQKNYGNLVSEFRQRFPAGSKQLKNRKHLYDEKLFKDFLLLVLLRSPNPVIYRSSLVRAAAASSTDRTTT